MSVYGNVDTRNPINENHDSLPISHYGNHKLAAEKFLNIHASVNPEFKHTSFRMFNVYGPGQNLDNLKQGMISIYLALLEREGVVTVKGNLDRFRDFIHIDDVVKAWVSALSNEKTFGKTYNLGTGVLNEVKNVLKELVLSFKNENDFMKYVKQSGNTPGDVTGVLADMNRFKSDFGFIPAIGLKEGMKTLSEWRNK
jgi:UDP-glucose 4-epimerase